jgi:hypothetical protein
MFYYLFLIIVLSFESVTGLPLFFLYLSYKLVSRRSNEFVLIALFVMALLLAIFYSLSWPVLALLLVLYHLLSQKFFGQKLLQVCLFILLNLSIFFMARIQLNYFYLADLVSFLLYFYLANFKKYAA